METLSTTLKAKRRRLPISLTPLIDVVFILLVFFMLASSFQKTRSVELTTPQKGTSSTAPLDKQPVIILIKGKDQYVINDQSYRLNDLNTFLQERREQTFLLKTGKNAALQDLVFLLDLTASLSLSKVSLLPFEENAS